MGDRHPWCRDAALTLISRNAAYLDSAKESVGSVQLYLHTYIHRCERASLGLKVGVASSSW